MIISLQRVQFNHPMTDDFSNDTPQNIKPKSLKFYQYKNDHLQATKEMKKFQNDSFHKFTNTAQVKEIPIGNITMVHHDIEQDIYVSEYLSNNALWEEKDMSQTAKHIDLILNKYEIYPCNQSLAIHCDKDIIKNKLGILDVGANIGVWSIPFGKYFQDRYPFISIFSFEPLWSNYMLLSKSIELNKLSNIYLYPYALTNEGDIGDTKSFIIDAKNKGHSHIEGEHSWSENDGETIKVETLPLDLMLKSQKFRPRHVIDGFQNILWMKIDTEGYEKFVFLGGEDFFADYKAGAPCFIRTEFVANRQEMLDILSKYGYFLVGTPDEFDWKAIQQKERKTLHSQKEDVIFVKNDVQRCIQHKIKNIYKINE